MKPVFGDPVWIDKRDKIPENFCATCGYEKEWRQCGNCDEDGFEDHDCGEDVCCCLHPEPNVPCDICNGQGGWLQCYKCAPWED